MLAPVPAASRTLAGLGALAFAWAIACAPTNLHAASALAPASPPAPAASSAGIGFATVEAALAALHADPAVAWRMQEGWTLALDSAHQTLWSFAPPGQPAYPAAIKRALVHREDGATMIEMKVLCQAPRPACDDLVRQFAARTQAAIARQRASAASDAAAPASTPSP